MRFMVIVKADRNSEAGVLTSEELLAEMGRFNEEMAKAFPPEEAAREQALRDELQRKASGREPDRAPTSH